MQVVPGDGTVRLAVGDDLFQAENPEFIKIDAEGMEMAVLAGLECLIARCSPSIFVEVDNQNREAFEAWRIAHRYSIVKTYRRYSQNENLLLMRG